MKRFCASIVIVACIGLTYHSSEAQASLRLLVNYSYTDTISPGDPVIFELQLYNAEAEHAAMHNSVVRQNIDRLEREYAEGTWTQEEYDAEKAILEKSIKPTSPITVPGESLVNRIHILFDRALLREDEYVRCNGYPVDETYTLTAEARLIMRFGIMPDKTTPWLPGRHSVMMTVDSLQTDSLDLVVVRNAPDVVPSHEKRIRHGYFHLECGDPADALRIAEQILTTTPDYLDAITLKADAYLALDDAAQALEWYQRALRTFYIQYPDSYELPEYLLNKIAALTQRE